MDLKKGVSPVSILILVCVLFVAFASSNAVAIPVNKITYSNGYAIGSVQGSKFCTVHFSNGQVAYNTYNLQASRDLLNSRVLAFSKRYGLGITQPQIISRTNACYAARISYKSKGTVTINYP